MVLGVPILKHFRVNQYHAGSAGEDLQTAEVSLVNTSQLVEVLSTKNSYAKFVESLLR